MRDLALRKYTSFHLLLTERQREGRYCSALIADVIRYPFSVSGAITSRNLGSVVGWCRGRSETGGETPARELESGLLTRSAYVRPRVGWSWVVNGSCTYRAGPRYEGVAAEVRGGLQVVK